LFINKFLPKSEKIRVISISRGYGQRDKGYRELADAVAKAVSENVFVITVSSNLHYSGFQILGACRQYNADPDDFDSYEPTLWERGEVIRNENPAEYRNRTLFPIGSRTYAGPTGTDSYEITYGGGISWAVPWCAGFYALCVQVKPDITPSEFIKAISSTHVPVSIEHNGRSYMFGNMVNPAGVISMIKG